MSRLFVNLYLDEDVDVLVAKLMQAYGFQATTTQAAGQLGATDEEQLAHASRHERAILTHNRADFEALAQAACAEAARTHHGIFLAVRRSPYEIARRLRVILNHVTAGEMQNQVRYI